MQLAASSRFSWDIRNDYQAVTVHHVPPSLGSESASGAQAAKTATPAGAFRAFRAPMFRRYFAGQIASASGTFLQQTAIGWLLLQLTGSATSLGLVLAQPPG